MTNYEKLQKVLTDVFQLDQADLDFGIYRILNQKRNEITEFLDKKLPVQIKELLSSNQSVERIQIQKDLEKAIRSARELDVEPDSLPKVVELKQKLENFGNIEELEQEVFSHLINFFKRYYKDGDFISLRRYKKDVYAIPYEGEEVKLYWANQDQYYIKTSEYLKNYAFNHKGKTIKFVLKEASTEQNNNKATKDMERRFAIFEETPVEVEDGVLFINFTYELYKKTVKQKDLAKNIIDTVKENLPINFADIFDTDPTPSNKQRTVIEKHVDSFVSRNTFDYFIHKDLNKFLTRELDFYIKNEVLFIDDIDVDNEHKFTEQLSKMVAIKGVAKKIIQFLAQIEDFQKKLWLKKKFVVASDYCITIDLIPESYYSEIVENQEQVAEWKSLYDVDIKTIDDLKNELFMVIDTKFYTQDFKDRLLAEFDNLDEKIDGLLINSENFQALNLLQEKYREKVDTVYIDPPYNTDSSPIAYKNNYKDSSWNSLIYDRMLLERELLKKGGLSITAIDDIELRYLFSLKDLVFNRNNYIGFITTICNPQGRVSNKMSKTSEYHLFYANDIEGLSSELRIDKIESKKKETPFKRTGTNSRREDRPLRHYPIFYKNGKLSLPTNEEYDKIYDKMNKVFNEEFLNELSNKYLQMGYEVIIPQKEDGTKLVWQREFPRAQREISTYIYREGTIYTPHFNDEIPKTTWTDAIYANPEYGTELVKEMFGEKYLDRINHDVALNTAKSIYTVEQCIKSNNASLILDYFSGSGTTAHSTINLNRGDKRNTRKYILIEMGKYFNFVTKPRVQKAIYNDKWKNGKPQDKKGISQIFKYMTLESYEDTLNNLNLRKTDSQVLAFANHPEVEEEYLLQYMLDIESRDNLFNIEMFRNPFNYQLNITENNELRPTRVDLVETFNYLIGLTVDHTFVHRDVKFVEGHTRNDNKALIIWRNIDTTSGNELNDLLAKLDIKVSDGEYDVIYVNGDHHLANLRKEESTWKVQLIEEVFFNRMFDVKEL